MVADRRLRVRATAERKRGSRHVRFLSGRLNGMEATVLTGCDLLTHNGSWR